MPTGAGILARARRHIGQNYDHGLVPKNDPDWKGPWDCAEFASWLVFQEGKTLYGCTNDAAPPATADAYTGSWRADSDRLGKRISVAEAAVTPGAFLLRYPPKPGTMGHIAVSDGNGGTVEAKGRQYGVVADRVAGRRWDTGVLIPGIDYKTETAPAEVPGPKILYARSTPNMNVTVVRAIQRALAAAGFDPGNSRGEFDDRMAEAVGRFQAARGIVADGEVGDSTATLLGLPLGTLAGAIGAAASGVVATNPLLAVATMMLPAIARAVAGDPAGEVATRASQAVAEVTGVSDPSDASARLDADPALRSSLQIRLAEIANAADQQRIDAEAAARKDTLAAEVRSRDADLREMSVQLADVQNARKAALEMEQAGGPSSWGPMVVSGIVTVGFFAILLVFILLTMGFGGAAAANRDLLQIVNISVGALTVAFSTVVTFWLGSSEGSRRKTRIAAANQALQPDRDKQVLDAAGRLAVTIAEQPANRTTQPPQAARAAAGR